ncbi:MAG: M16 family metallopeptidase [Bacteroidota bacterium]
MKRSKLFLSLLLWLPLMAAANPPESDWGIMPYPIKQQRLQNGLNVVTVEYPSPGIAAFYIVVRVGSRNEIEPGHTGFAHFFEHMMFRGTDKYPKERYSEVLKSTGASANANTSLDRTVYHMTGSSAKLETMFELEADRFQNLKYSVQGFKTEAGAVKGEYTKNSANPYTKLNELVQNAAFSSHTYKHTTMGFFEDIVDMPNQYDYSIDFFKRYYRPEYATIIVVGDVTHSQVVSLSEKYFGEWAKGNYTSTIPAEPEQKETRSTHLQKEGFPPYLSLNYKGPGYSDTDLDFPSLDILCSMLFSENSSFYEEMVIKQQKLRSVEAGAYNTRDPFLISVEASLVNASDMKYVKNKIVDELDKAKKGQLDAQAMEAARMNLKNSFRMRIDNPTSIAENLSFFTWLSGDPQSLNRYYANYDKVTMDDLQRVAKKYFTAQRLTIGTISPNESEKIK